MQIMSLTDSLAAYINTIRFFLFHHKLDIFCHYYINLFFFLYELLFFYLPTWLHNL